MTSNRLGLLLLLCSLWVLASSQVRARPYGPEEESSPAQNTAPESEPGLETSHGDGNDPAVEAAPLETNVDDLERHGPHDQPSSEPQIPPVETASDTMAPDQQSLERLRSKPLNDQEILDLRIQGNLKIEDDAILAVIRSSARYSIPQIRTDVKAVYGLGYFRDVQVDVQRQEEGLVVTFIVVEKPSVRTVRVEGNKKVDKEDIQEVISLKLFSILNEATIQEDTVHIKSVYAEKGYYLAEITPEINPLNENEVEVIFKVEEKDKVLVQKMYFIGADKVKPKEFRRFLETKEGGFLPWLSSSGTFDQAQLENDAMIIQAFYTEKGYLQARVEPPQAFMGTDKKSLYITIRIHEGQRYKVRDISVSGDPITPPDKLRAMLKSTKGDWFTRSVIGEDIETLTDFYSDQGYAFTNVIPIPEIHEDTQEVDMVFEITRGKKIYLDQIKISGNTVTWDKVVRREIQINEGELYHGGTIKDAKRRLERLGYFEEVKISTPKAGADDMVSMEVEVHEKPTGTFNIGAGFSSLESFIFNANISKQNFLGLGYVMGAAAQLSRRRQQYNLSFFDPYFMDTRWTFRADGYNIEQNYVFSEYRRGLDFALGHYIGRSDDARFALKYTLEKVGLRATDLAWLSYLGGELTRGGVLSSIEATFTIDRRNNRITPSKGYLISASSELAGGFRINGDTLLSLFGGDFNFNRHQLNFRLYVPMYPKIEDMVVFRVNSTVGGIWSTDGRSLPMLHRYRAGGINSVRGYDILSLGPMIRITNTDEPSRKDTRLVIGGYQIMTTNVEIEFAILRSAGIRGVVFFDAGNGFDLFGMDVYANSDKYPRLATGFGIRWFSPMGPLRFEWGFPLTQREGERNQIFEFTIGSFF